MRFSPAESTPLARGTPVGRDCGCGWGIERGRLWREPRGGCLMKTKSLRRAVAVAALSLAASVASCSSSSTNNGSGANCSQACAGALAAHCQNDTQATCMAKYQNPFPSCQAQFDTAAVCIAAASWICVAGSGKPQGCDADPRGRCD